MNYELWSKKLKLSIKRYHAQIKIEKIDSNNVIAHYLLREKMLVVIT